MLNMPGFSVQALIYESANSLVYRANRQSDNQPIILKILKENYPTPAELARYRTEYQLTQSLDVPGVVKVYDLQKYQNTLVMSLEDFGGESLKIWMQQRFLSLEEFLRIAIATTETLGHIHAANIIHKDINPSNIVFNPATEQLKIIDFGISTKLTRENTTLKNPNILEGTLAYMSPEQTGRMNRSLDYRTDFYSLGVTFYEMLTGKLPFETADVLELVHCHIAKVPILPHEVNPEIPKTVSDIVMKLMAKTAEERYQSSWGIKADLEVCLNQLQSTGAIAIFPLAERDISGKFQLPQKLYGREREIEILVSAFERSSADKSELMLVAGYSGIGKSALVQELYKPITQKRGYFISGKFDQYQRNIPYSAIVAAFRELIKQLLSETETQLNQWREKLLAALGINGQVIVEVIPEIELIIGKQPAVPELGPNESQNRFNFTFENFIKVFTKTEHPLAIFIDDLQWADGASLKLMQLLMSGASTGLFLIGTYRDNEVSSAHPLMLAVEEMAKSGAIVNQISLSPLQLSTVTEIISDILKYDGNKTKLLAEVVILKTGGNPFFANEFLKSLYTEKLLKFEVETQLWQWNLDEIEARDFSDNVVELMAGKIQKLSEAAQQILKLAACIGNQFDLKTISLIGKKSLGDTAFALQAAVAESLVVPAGSMGEVELAKILPIANAIVVTEFCSDGLLAASSQSLEYKFAHDRIQQAAYTLIGENERPIIHRKIGQLLLQSTAENKQEEKIFDIVNQLNFSLSLITEQSEKYELAQLNLTAGKKAKLSTAYQPALNYLQVGIELLASDSWQQQYSLTLALYEEAAETAYLSADFVLMEKFLTEVFKHAKNILDKIKVYEIKILACNSQGKFTEVLDVGLEGLKMLGISFPKNPNKLDVLWGLLQIKFQVKMRSIASLIDLPLMSNPDSKAAVCLLSRICSTTYLVMPRLFLLVTFQVIHLTLNWGTAPESAFFYSIYGLILCGVVGDIESGFQFSQLALNLTEKIDEKIVKNRIEYIVYGFIKHWKAPVKEMLSLLQKAYVTGLEVGELEYAYYSISCYCMYSFLSGYELAQLEVEMAAVAEAMCRKRGFNLNLINHQAVLNLLGPSENPCNLIGKICDEQAILPMLQTQKDGTAIFCLYFNKLQLCFLFGEVQQAVTYAEIAEKYLDSITATVTTTHFYFYDSLARLAEADKAEKLQKKLLIQKAIKNQKKMKIWANYAPMNNLHKYLLVKAEICRVQSQDAIAMEMYDKAITTAKENEYIHEEAIAYELAAKFYLSRGKELIAKAYIQEAYYCYQLWGAAAKVKDLEMRYSHLLTVTQSGSNNSKPTTSVTTTGSAKNLDIATVMKASQAISGEIVLDNLLAKLMKILIENAGAQKGFLILPREGKLQIEAKAAVYSEEVLVETQALSPESLPLKIINYVERTREDVVLSNAAVDGQFTADPYIAQQELKSLLCAPILNQGNLIGIVYLENNLTTAAFTSQRLEIVRILSSQAAISLENALLYQTLEQKVRDRTAQLADANQEITILNDRLKAENIRMSAELDVTRKLQHMILPTEDELHQIPGLEIAGFMEPAEEVGGDYYDVIKSGDRIKVGIGDVTGHGLESGVLMIMVQTAVRALLENNETDSNQFLEALNRTIYKNVTRMNSDKNLSLSLLDYENGILRLSGQHEEMLVVRSGGEVERIDTINLGFPIGLEADIADFVAQIEVPLNSGDVVVLYTDGITEAEDINGVQYGLDRLMEVISRNWQLSANEIKQIAIDDVRQHIGKQKVYDDITLVVLKKN